MVHLACSSTYADARVNANSVTTAEGGPFCFENDVTDAVLTPLFVLIEHRPSVLALPWRGTNAMIVEEGGTF